MIRREGWNARFSLCLAARAAHTLSARPPMNNLVLSNGIP